MRSRPARLTLSALAWIALGAAAFYTFHSQQQIDHRRSALRAFEASARDAADALDDAQAGQLAYVAIGQDPAEWFPKVSTYLEAATAAIESLRASASSSGAGPALLDANTALTQIGNIDRQVRAHVAAEELKAAADAIFTDGADAFSGAMANVDLAISAEQQGADAFEAGLRRLQLYALGGAAGFAVLILGLLGIANPASSATATAEDAESSESANDTTAGLSLHTPSAFTPGKPEVPVSVADTKPLQTMAEICTKFGRVRDASELKPLLEQAAGVLNARGIMVWLGSTAGADLRPVLAHGYSDKTLANIPVLARTADTAAASAYRNGDVQIVKSRDAGQLGAIIAPMLTADGCIGAVSAEIRDRGEQSEQTRALTLILAAQLAGLLAAAADPSTGTTAEPHAAAG